MKHVIAIFMVLFITLSSAATADTIYLLNGDHLNGTIKTASFELVTPYQLIDFPKGLITFIQLGDKQESSVIVATVNNDRFSGILSNQIIDIQFTNGDLMHINKESINAIEVKRDGHTAETTTTFFTMKNQDRFTGRILTEIITIISDQLALPVDVTDINRLDVTEPETNSVRIRLNNGGLINGVLQGQLLEIESETISVLSVCVSGIDSIQRNAEKYIFTQYSGPSLCSRQNDCE